MLRRLGLRALGTTGGSLFSSGPRYLSSCSGSGLIHSEAYIGGRWLQADGAARFPVQDPATGQLLAEVADCGPREAREAVKAAHSSLASWRGVTSK
eukprot:g23602.t1